MRERMNVTAPEERDRYRFNYMGTHRYLIKQPTHLSTKIFTDGKVVLTVLDQLREACWEHHFDVYAYCFLPDQLVLIARGKSEHSDMKAFLTLFRSRSTEALKQELNHPLWKRKYLERVLRKDERSKFAAMDIFQLPVKAGLVSKPEEYAFQGSFVIDVPRSRKTPQ